MKQIKLTQGRVALIDDEDFETLNPHKWSATNIKGIWYAHRGKREPGKGRGVYGKVKRISMHRVIMGVNDRHIFIDHKDGNGLNNQKSNLRRCTNAENLRNAKASGETSKYKGVSKAKPYNILKSGLKIERFYWIAQIKSKTKHIYLGCFPYTKEGEIEAAKAYNEKAKELFGEFAKLNEI